MEKESCERFHDVEYNIRTRVEDTSLYVEVIQKSDRSKWSNLFSCRYIEEMTQKTGNFKAFDVFCKMLMRGLESPGDVVFIDLLTYADLESLKQRKGGRTANLNATTRTKNKRYLIITYVAEYDRVHYPLALKWTDESTSTICSSLASDSIAHSPRGNENIPPSSSTPNLFERPISATTVSDVGGGATPLQRSMSAHHGVLGNSHAHFDNIPISPRTYRQLLTENEVLRRQVSDLKNDHSQDKAATLVEEVRMLRSELARRDAEVRRLKKQQAEFDHLKLSRKLDELEEEVERLGTELIEERTKHRRMEKQHRTEKTELERTIEVLEDNENKHRVRTRNLQEELEQAQHQLDVSRRKASRSRLFSTKSTNSLPKKSEDLRRSRSRTTKTLASREASKPPLKSRSKRGERNETNRRQRNKQTRPRSLSASRQGARGRSPARFDPTAWVKKKQKKLASRSRERPVWGANSRSASPRLRSARSSSSSRQNTSRRKTTRSAKRNSFGTLVRRSSRSASPQGMRKSQSSAVLKTRRANVLRVRDEEKSDVVETTIPSPLPEVEDVSVSGDTEMSFNPTKEIESIDARLNALQKFLRAAKAKSDK